MFSLVITVVSIILTAALALVTLYYGGASFSKGDAEVRVLKILNEGQQLVGAADLFKADRGVYPNSIGQLVNEGYLQSIPTTQSLLGITHAQSSINKWEMPKAGVLVFVMDIESVDICRNLNKMAYGQNGVLPSIQTQYIVQCWGSKTGGNISRMQVVFAKSSQSILEAADNLAALVTDQPLPAPSAAADWTVPPGLPPGTSNGGGTGSPDVTPPTGGGTQDPDAPAPTPDPSSPPSDEVANVFVGANSWCSSGVWWSDPFNPNSSTVNSYFALRVANDAWYIHAMQTGGISVEVQARFGTFVDMDTATSSRAYVLEPSTTGENAYIIGELSAHSPLPAAQMWGPDNEILSTNPQTPLVVRLIPRSGQQQTATLQIYCNNTDQLPVITSVTHSW